MLELLNINEFNMSNYRYLKDGQGSTNNTLDVISQVIGWIYFVAWSVSFYGQIYQNIKNKSVSGLSFDFQILNFFGFLGYSVYNVWCYINQNMGAKPKIQDVLFSTHAFVATCFTIVQCFYYYNPSDPNQKVATWSISIVVCLSWGFFIVILIEQILKMYDPSNNKGKVFPFNAIIYLGWTKAIVSLVKYIPQVILNIKRKSTKGWSMENVILDFTGGSFSLIQNIIDSINEKSIISDDNNYALNFVKYAVSIIAMIFDIVFVIQHFIIYKDSNKEYYKLNNIVNENSDTSYVNVS